MAGFAGGGMPAPAFYGGRRHWVLHRETGAAARNAVGAPLNSHKPAATDELGSPPRHWWITGHRCYHDRTAGAALILGLAACGGCRATGWPGCTHACPAGTQPLLSMHPAGCIKQALQRALHCWTGSADIGRLCTRPPSPPPGAAGRVQPCRHSGTLAFTNAVGHRHTCSAACKLARRHLETVQVSGGVVADSTAVPGGRPIVLHAQPMRSAVCSMFGRLQQWRSCVGQQSNAVPMKGRSRHGHSRGRPAHAAYPACMRQDRVTHAGRAQACMAG